MKKKSRQKCLGWCAAWVSFVTCNTSQPAVMIDILMDPLAWAVLLSQNAASCLDTICCSHFNSYDRCEKPFLSKHQEGLSKPLVHSISYSKIIFLKLELVHVELLHWHDWHSIFPKLRVEFLLPPYSRQMKPRRKLDLLTCQGKKFCAFFSFYCALTPFSITSINSLLLWDGIWDFCRIATPTSTLFTHNITSFPSYLFIS